MSPILRFFKCFILLLLFLFPFVFTSKLPNFTDWDVYVTAGNKFINGQGVYDVVGHYQFKYAPSVAAIFAFLLQLFSSDFLKWVNYFLSLGLALYFIFKALDLSKKEESRFDLPSFLWSLLFVASFSLPLRDDLKLGQVNIWALVFLYGFWKNRDSRKILWPALLWSLAVSLKLYALIFAPLLLFQRRWKLIVVSAVMFWSLNYFLPLLWVAPSQSFAQNIEWLRTLTQSSSELLGSHYDVSVLGIVTKLGFSKTTALSVWVFLLCFFLWISFKFSKRLELVDHNYFALALSWIYLLNPLVWPYWCFLLAPYLAKGLWGQRSNSRFCFRKDRVLWALSALLLVLCHRNNTPLALHGGLAIVLVLHQFILWQRMDQAAL